MLPLILTGRTQGQVTGMLGRDPDLPFATVRCRAVQLIEKRV